LRVVGEPALPAQGLLWLVRIVLFVSVIAHIVAATVLARRARPPDRCATPTALR
jgi:succinate dehydrogenase / fumarate reductase cytochrome b subunit